MKGIRLRTLVLVSAVALGPQVSASALQTKDQEILNQAKVLMFGQKWEEARQVFQRLIRDFPRSNLLPQAYFQMAYCLRLENKSSEDALRAYDQFLQKYPNEPFYAVQARQTVVDLSAALVEKGKSEYRSRLITALKDPQKEVRYLAGLRCGSLKDHQLNLLSVPVLKEIVAKEKQPDYVVPASIALMAIDPIALARPEPQKPAKGQSRQGDATVKMFHIRIYEGSENTPPKVELNIPVSFAQLAIAALDESTKEQLRKNGFDIDNFSESLNRLGPANILTIHDGRNILKIWIK